MSATRHRVVITCFLLQKPAAGRSVARKSGGAADRWDELGAGMRSRGCVQGRYNGESIPHGSGASRLTFAGRLSLSGGTLRHRLAGVLLSLSVTHLTSVPPP